MLKRWNFLKTGFYEGINFDSLDPHAGTGLNHPAKLTKDIWAEYEEAPKRLFAEAHRAYLCVAGKPRS